MAPEFAHHYAQLEGVRLHYVTMGSGTPVVLLHGWPQTWYEWRRVMPLLADKYTLVAPDMRGLGDSSRPASGYDKKTVANDIWKLMHDHLKHARFGVVGHDWGAPVAWHCALLRPDIFRAISLLSVPYFPRGPGRPTEMMKAMAGADNFYQLYFQEPGRVENELDEDPRRSMAMILYSASGDAAAIEEWKYVFPKNMRFIDTGVVPKKLPKWLTEADLDFFAGEFKRAGFRGGVNWYRNSDRNWELTAFLDGAKLQQPAVFAAGEHDLVGKMIPGGYEHVGLSTPNLSKKVIIPGAGHWIQQERPEEINDLLIEFLQNLG
jgi:pimeloyl-ACP methyl ester carboxylesterase